MKKLFTLLFVALTFINVNAQRKCDMLVTATSPTGTITGGVGFDVNAKVKNLGPDAIKATDTVVLFVVVNTTITPYYKAYGLSFAVNEERTLNVITGFSVNGPQASLNVCALGFLQNRSADSVRDMSSTNNLGCNSVNLVWKTGVANTADVYIIDGIKLFPNPVVDQTKITYSLNQPADIRIAVKDITGREVMMVLNEKQGTGIYEKDLDLSSLKAGVYMVEYLVGDKAYTSKLIKN